jgi:hypothetical protein
MTWARRYDEGVPHEPLRFPAVPHRAAGVDCAGTIVSEADGENVTLKCDTCGVVVGSMHANILAAMEQAIADILGLESLPRKTAATTTRSGRLGMGYGRDGLYGVHSARPGPYFA